jgi:hypothetical protein
MARKLGLMAKYLDLAFVHPSYHALYYDMELLDR